MKFDWALVVGAIAIVIVFVFGASLILPHNVPISPPVAPVVPPATATCHPSGCSGEICSDQDVVSNCIYKPEFACYKTATCERQANGSCGWTQTPELLSCLSKAR